MLTFLTDIEVRALKGDMWVLTKDLVVDVGSVDGKDLITIPKGFPTDFGSVPSVGRLFVNPQGDAKPAFVLHDWLYANQSFNRVVCDAILNDGMESLKISAIQRALTYRCLRMGGWWAWNGHAKKRQKAKKAGKPYPELLAV